MWNMSFLSLFGIIMLLSAMVSTKTSIKNNLATPARDTEIEGKMYHFDAIPANYSSIVIYLVTGILSIAFITFGIVVLWHTGIGFYGMKFFN